MKKKIIIILSIFIALGLLLLLFHLLLKKTKNYIETYGNVEIRQVDLAFQVAGRINNVFVEEGDYVKQGDLIATLDDKDYKASYQKALALKESSKAQMDEDLSKYKRNIALCKDGTISPQDCDTLLNKKNMSKAQFQQNEANLIFQKNQLDYTKLYAPQDGIITTRSQEKGAYVGANQIVYVMSLTKPIWIRTYINEKDLGNIKYGQKAKILTDTTDTKRNEKKEYTGTIGYISPIAEFTPKTVQTQDLRVDLMYRIRVYVDEVDDFLRQGMPVTIRINLDQKNELH